MNWSYQIEMDEKIANHAASAGEEMKNGSRARAANRQTRSRPMPQRRDLTIDEAVRDPMIRLVMKADGVDPRAFENMLRSLADGQRREVPLLRSREGSRDGRGQLSRVASAFGRARAAGEACVSW
ncbi:MULTISPECIES: hypothetical protein [unclassified Mesorhizobium]|nr:MULTISPECIES: hypothetical protein [unclassified Mesorhizobium]